MGWQVCSRPRWWYYYFFVSDDKKEQHHIMTLCCKGYDMPSEEEAKQEAKKIIEEEGISVRRNKKGKPILYLSWMANGVVGAREILAGLAKTTMYAGEKPHKIKRKNIMLNFYGIKVGLHPELRFRKTIGEYKYRAGYRW